MRAKDAGRHHAMDLYRTVAVMTEAEYGDALQMGDTHRSDSRLEHVRQILASHFHNSASLGMLRLREHQLFRDDYPIQDFRTVLHEVFGMPDAQ